MELAVDGAFGGILLGLRSDKFSLVISRRGGHSVTCLYVSKENGLQWVFMGYMGQGKVWVEEHYGKISWVQESVG